MNQWQLSSCRTRQDVKKLPLCASSSCHLQCLPASHMHRLVPPGDLMLAAARVTQGGRNTASTMPRAWTTSATAPGSPTLDKALTQSEVWLQLCSSCTDRWWQQQQPLDSSVVCMFASARKAASCWKCFPAQTAILCDLQGKCELDGDSCRLASAVWCYLMEYVQWNLLSLWRFIVYVLKLKFTRQWDGETYLSNTDGRTGWCSAYTPKCMTFFQCSFPVFTVVSIRTGLHW